MVVSLGDLVNILQFKGKHFVCFHITNDKIAIYDRVFVTNAILMVSMASQLGFKPGMWYCQI